MFFETCIKTQTTLILVKARLIKAVSMKPPYMVETNNSFHNKQWEGCLIFTKMLHCSDIFTWGHFTLVVWLAWKKTHNMAIILQLQKKYRPLTLRYFFSRLLPGIKKLHSNYLINLKQLSALFNSSQSKCLKALTAHMRWIFKSFWQRKKCFSSQKWNRWQQTAESDGLSSQKMSS